ncbi:MAG: phage baseplate assembly protein V [Ardenticatenaceae bacterium]|nr:phage baseplate assembly protein V [Ardenticatenaceae bacterium]
MANEFLSWLAGVDTEEEHGFAIAPGIVTNNFDLIAEGRIQVRIPSRPGLEPWARLAAIGAGSSRGFLWVPQLDDEVLVGFNQGDETDAYILGGLWSTLDRPPVTIPTDFLIKRVLKTGLEAGIGHEIEFDDALQSITITSSTRQKITIDPLKIEMTNLAGTVKITLDNTQQAISIQAVNSIELKAAQIKLQAANIDIEGAVATNVKSTGVCNITAPLVKIN